MLLWSQVGRGETRGIGHALIVGLALVVALVGNLANSTGDFRMLALDRAAEMQSAFAHYDDRVPGDMLVKPPSPLTQLVNRPRQGVVSYRIQEGDVLTAIADKFEISLATILWANGLEETDVLDPGRQLAILPVSGVLHTVKPGEQVVDIARRYQSDVRAIVEFNQLTDPEQIVANEVLVVPGGRPEEKPRPVPSARSYERPQNEDLDLEPSAPAVPAAAPPQALKLSSYTVAQGDTLSGIAAKFGVSPETVMWANGLQGNPEFLKPGQTLTILPVSGALYTVASGDSLSEIAHTYGVDTSKIVAANALASADALFIGQKLIIPSAKLATAAEAAAQARAAAAAQAQIAGGLKYTVVPGDSLLAIAGKYGVEAAAIARASGLGSVDRLSIGQQLTIPGAQAQAASRPAAVAAAAPAPAATEDGARIVNIASKYLGYAYYWGGHSPATGFDCSGFVWYVYQQAGIRLPLHDLWGQLQAGPRISMANLQPGDIVFFQNTYRAGLSHNGIYIGGGRFINAEDYGKGVRVANINDAYWSARYFGASRPW